MSVFPTENHLVLLTTLGCSLCEKAKVELWPVLSRNRLQLIEWDIIHHPYLLNAFSVHIPVLLAGSELERFNWLQVERSVDSNRDDNEQAIPLVDEPIVETDSSVIKLEETGLYWPFTTDDIQSWWSQIKDI